MFEPVIEVNEFLKVYGDFKAVDRISFEVYPGEIYGLLGPIQTRASRNAPDSNNSIYSGFVLAVVI